MENIFSWDFFVVVEGQKSLVICREKNNIFSFHGYLVSELQKSWTDEARIKKLLILLNIWKLGIGPGGMLWSTAQEGWASAKYTRLATSLYCLKLSFFSFEIYQTSMLRVFPARYVLYMAKADFCTRLGLTPPVG